MGNTYEESYQWHGRGNKSHLTGIPPTPEEIGEVGIGLTARNRPLEQEQRWSHPKTARKRPSQRDKEDKSHLHVLIAQ